MSVRRWGKTSQRSLLRRLLMQLPSVDDTVVAVSSAWVPSPVGIVRFSGPDADRFLAALGVRVSCLDRRWCFAETRLQIPEISAEVPATVFRFVAPHSYTGQTVVELHTVGNLSILRELCAGLLRAGARRALPGEFTARAYLNGKLKAEEVEGVLGLIHAHDSRARQHAARLSTGAYRRAVEEIQQGLLELITALEAGIDFVEEEDVRFIEPHELRAALVAGRERLAGLSRMSRDSERIELPHVALVGLPNAGKSTLFNALLGSERAIVSPVIGTTRDVLSAEVALPGGRAVLQDCAGLGASADALELAAHVASEGAASRADLVLWIHPRDAVWTSAEREVLERIDAARLVFVESKCDLPGVLPTDEGGSVAGVWVSVSASTGEGIDALREAIARKLFAAPAEGGTALDWESLERICVALDRTAALVSVSGFTLPELVALELRAIHDELDTVNREPLAENVLGRIFARFCIGK